MTGEDIAQRARQAIGAAFRLYGRDVATGVDCVGLVAHAAALIDVPRDYRLRGDYQRQIKQTLTNRGFVACDDAALLAGDILLLRAGPQQLHLAVVEAAASFIHAHAGLRRIVRTPLPLPWPLLGHWRISGD